MAENGSLTQYQAAQKKRIKVSALMIFLVIPALLGVSILLINSKMYMLLSLLILTAIMTPFFMVFERRKPKAREIVLIAVLSAITVVLHLFFFFFLPIQIGTALVIIFGIALGPEAGFLIGALSRFICNFYMGQGMWTPWQMFCWGLLGFLAGLCFNKNDMQFMRSKNPIKSSVKDVMAPVLSVVFFELIGIISIFIFPETGEGILTWRVYLFGFIGVLFAVLIQRRRISVTNISIAVFTFIATFIIYGGIMNFAAMVTGMNMGGAEGFSVSALKALYISGIPYDFMHASGATLSAFLIGKPMIEKIERIKIKYGIYK